MHSAFFRSLVLLAWCCAAGCFTGEPSAVGEKKKPETAAVSTATLDKKASLFPIDSPHYADIDDEKSADGDMPEATAYSIEAMRDIVSVLQNCTQEQVKGAVDRSATYKKIFTHPQDYRGHVVQFESTLKFLYENAEKLKDEKGNIIPLARGHASTSYLPITYLSLEPLPAGMKLDDPVLVTGVFQQLFVYENRNMPGRELTWTPLIVCKKLEKMVVKDEPPMSNAYIIGDIIFAMVAVGLLLLYADRQGIRVVRSNVFTRMKKQRDGGERLFPGPSGDFKKKS